MGAKFRGLGGRSRGRAFSGRRPPPCHPTPTPRPPPPHTHTHAGSHVEAMRGLESIRTKKETELASVCALIYFHMQAGGIDREAIAGLQRDLEVARERAPPSAMILASTFFWHIGDLTEARQYVDKVLALDGTNKSAQSLRGWIDLSVTSTSGRSRDQFEKSVQWFDGVLGDQESRYARMCVCVCVARRRTCAAWECRGGVGHRGLSQLAAAAVPALWRSSPRASPWVLRRCPAARRTWRPSWAVPSTLTSRATLRRRWTA
jgi:hypothetical protein